MKRIADNAISELCKTDEIIRIYQKWFQSPIPPNGTNLNWPMSDELQSLGIAAAKLENQH